MIFHILVAVLEGQGTETTAESESLRAGSHYDQLFGVVSVFEHLKNTDCTGPLVLGVGQVIWCQSNCVVFHDSFAFPGLKHPRTVAISVVLVP